VSKELKLIDIEGDTIIGIGDDDSVGVDMRRIDVGGRMITPGLIDIHTHGALGYTFNEPTRVSFATIARENARRGVTSLLATTTTAPIEALVKCLEFGRQWMVDSPEGA
jgi:N-acetylglucosamine-6-phosphate deacetylase